MKRLGKPEMGMANKKERREKEQKRQTDREGNKKQEQEDNRCFYQKQHIYTWSQD